MRSKLATLVCLMMALMLMAALPLSTTADEEPGVNVAALTTQTRENLWYELGAWLRMEGTYPFMDLKRGDRNLDVFFLQYRLFELGYYAKAFDYQFGPGTENGMKLFQKANSLPMTGRASAADQKHLYSLAAVPNPGYALNTGNLAKPGPTNPPKKDGPLVPNPGQIGVVGLNPEVINKPSNVGQHVSKPETPKVDISKLITPTPTPYEAPGLIDVPIVTPSIQLPGGLFNP